MKYLVISRDMEDSDVFFPSTYYDRAISNDEREAMEQIAKLRPYAQPVATFTGQELIDCATAMLGRSEEQIKAELGEIRAEHEAGPEEVRAEAEASTGRQKEAAILGERRGLKPLYAVWIQSLKKPGRQVVKDVIHAQSFTHSQAESWEHWCAEVFSNSNPGRMLLIAARTSGEAAQKARHITLVK